MMVFPEGLPALGRAVRLARMQKVVSAIRYLSGFIMTSSHSVVESNEMLALPASYSHAHKPPEHDDDAHYHEDAALRYVLASFAQEHQPSQEQHGEDRYPDGEVEAHEIDAVAVKGAQIGQDVGVVCAPDSGAHYRYGRVEGYGGGRGLGSTTSSTASSPARRLRSHVDYCINRYYSPWHNRSCICSRNVGIVGIRLSSRGIDRDCVKARIELLEDDHIGGIDNKPVIGEWPSPTRGPRLRVVPCPAVMPTTLGVITGVKDGLTKTLAV